MKGSACLRLIDTFSPERAEPRLHLEEVYAFRSDAV